MKRRRRHRVGRALVGIGVAGVLGVGLLCSGLVSLAMAIESGEGFVLSVALASLTAVPYGLALVWLDRNEREPPALIVMALAWGALVATMFAGVFNDLFQSVALDVTGSRAAAAALTASFSAPFFEESFKGVAVGLLWLLFWDELDGVLDGLLYGALVGLGFAWFENIVYYARAFDSDGVAGLLGVSLFRGFVMAGLGSHMAYTALTGIGFGLTRVLRRGVSRWLLVPAGWIAAMLGHFAWNGVLSFGTGIVGDGPASGLALFVLLIGSQLPFGALVLGVMALAWRHEDRVIVRYLEQEPLYVSAEDLRALVPARRRTLASWARLFQRGPAAWWRGRLRDHAQIELAFARWHHDRDAPGWDASVDEDVRAARARVASLSRSSR